MSDAWLFRHVQANSSRWESLPDVRSYRSLRRYVRGMGVHIGRRWRYRLPDPILDSFTVPVLSCYRYLTLRRKGAVLGWGAEELEVEDVPVSVRTRHAAALRRKARAALKFLKEIDRD